jgi:hypothetical protein
MEEASTIEAGRTATEVIGGTERKWRNRIVVVQCGREQRTAIKWVGDSVRREEIMSRNHQWSMKGNLEGGQRQVSLSLSLSLDLKPQRSPEGSKHSIDIAPSLTLINQSFNSVGDGNYFNVDSTLQNDSFGLDGGRAKSVDEDAAQLLQMNSSICNADAWSLPFRRSQMGSQLRRQRGSVIDVHLSAVSQRRATERSIPDSGPPTSTSQWRLWSGC